MRRIVAKKRRAPFTIGNLGRMFIVTLLTNPAPRVLDRVTVESPAQCLGRGRGALAGPRRGGGIRPGGHCRKTAGRSGQDLQALRIDLAVQPAEGRKKRLLIADMDSTMIRQECIDELADEAGVGAHVAGITARAMNGELDFEAALRERVGLLKGLPEAVIAQVLRDRITLMPGGPVLLATMKAQRAPMRRWCRAGSPPLPRRSRRGWGLTRTAPTRCWPRAAA